MIDLSAIHAEKTDQMQFLPAPTPYEVGQGRIYPIDTATRILMLCMGLFFLIVGLACAYISSLPGGTKAQTLVLAASPLFIFAFACSAIVFSIRTRTILYPDRLETVGIFRKQSFAKTKIAGYQTEKGYYFKLITLPHYTVSSPVYQFQKDEKFEEWMKPFPDLTNDSKVTKKRQSTGRVYVAVVLAVVAAVCFVVSKFA